MKKVSFSFLCDQDHNQMEAKGNTRFCTSCSKNIIDFTGMDAKTISEHLKTAAKPCGFMRPQQLEEVNAYLSHQAHPKSSRTWTKLVRLAAVVSTPLVFQPAYTQTVVNTTQQQPTSDKMVALKASDGSPLKNIAIDVYGDDEWIVQLQTNENGLISLGSDFDHYRFLRLENKILGIEKNISATPGNVCLVWQTTLAPQAIVKSTVAEEALTLDFRFEMSTHGKIETLKSMETEVVLYDSLSVEISRIKVKTDKHGHIAYDYLPSLKAQYFMFAMEIEGGYRTSFVHLQNVDPNNTNVVTVERYEEILMGIMIAD